MTSVHSSAEGGASIPGELVARLEAASVGSRELDREIMELAYRWERRHIGARCWDDENDTCCPDAKHLDWVWVDPLDDKWKTNAREGFDFTTSLDAALALAERVLGEAYALDLLRDMLELHEADGVSIKTLPLALCIAILKATTAPEAGAVGTTVGREPEIDTTREGADR